MIRFFSRVLRKKLKGYYFESTPARNLFLKIHRGISEAFPLPGTSNYAPKDRMRGPIAFYTKVLGQKSINIIGETNEERMMIGIHFGKVSN